jgi:Protein of unknown function (DUF433)
MSNPAAMFRGIVHGNTIKFDGELGIPDGQEVTVIVQPPLPAEGAPERLPPGEGIRRSAGAWAEDCGTRAPSSQERPENLPGAELWADRLIFDSSISPDARIVKGTRLAAEALVAELQQGRADEEMLSAHPELSIEDVKALRAYARVPVGFRLSFGAWAEDGDELDRYIKSVYERRRTQQRRPIE